MSVAVVVAAAVAVAVVAAVVVAAPSFSAAEEVAAFGLNLRLGSEESW